MLDTLGLISTSFGDWQGRPGGEHVELTDTAAGRHLSLQFKGDVLIERQEMLAILDAAMRTNEAEAKLDDARFELEAQTTAAKSLRRAVLDAKERVASLQAMIEGRTTPPTLAEVQAHVVNRGGWWLIVEEYDFGRYLIERESDIALYVGRAVRWIACDSCGCPCGWPLAPVDTVVREKTT